MDASKWLRLVFKDLTEFCAFVPFRVYNNGIYMKQLDHPLTIVFFITLLAFMMGCAPVSNESVQPAATPTIPVAQQITPTSLASDSSFPALAAGALFRVVKPDGSAVMFTVDDIKALPLAQYLSEGKVEEGPGLLDVLNKAGVTDFKDIIISGPQSSQTLTRAQVDGQTVLDLTNHGTVKFAGPALDKADWVHDVDLIVVH